MTYVPEGYIIVFEAPQRYGKTLSGVIWALDAYQKKRNVFSNIQLGFPHKPLEFNEVQLEDNQSRFWNGHIFIDELNFYYDSRRSLTGANINFGSFMLQQKKQGCNLTGTTHSLSSLDLRFREHYDFLIRPTVYPKFPKKPDYVRMQITNGPLQAAFDKTITLRCDFALGLYDSFAVYDPFRKQKEEKEARKQKRVSLD